MNSLTKLKISWKNSGLPRKIGIVVGLAMLLLVFVGFWLEIESENRVHQSIKDSEKNVQNSITNSTEQLLSGQRDILDILKGNISQKQCSEKFPTLMCVSSLINNCTPDVKATKDGLLIDGCDIVVLNQTLEGYPEGYHIYLEFKPTWSLNDTSPHYLLDFVGSTSLEANRASLYTQDKYLRYSAIGQNNLEERSIKLPLNLSNWNENKFNRIELGWLKTSGIMFLSLNEKMEHNLSIENINLTLSNATFIFIGSSASGKYQADGYFGNFSMGIGNVIRRPSDIPL